MSSLKSLKNALDHLQKYKSMRMTFPKQIIEEMHTEYIELEQENAKLKERLKDAENVILEFKKYTDDLIYLTDVEMGLIILNYLEKWGSDE